MTMPHLAGVELGGTKIFVLRAHGQDIIARESIPTTSPEDSLEAVRRILAGWNAAEPFAALGIASFGPLRLDRAAPDFGRMLPTPKAGRTDADIYGALSDILSCPVAIDTDVKAAALAELRWGAGNENGESSDSLCYITIGTGLGGGFAIHGKPVHGALHPEIGHIAVRRAPGDDFPGACPFHGDCIEGLVSGPALAKRFGRPGLEIPMDDPRWDFVAHDIARLVSTILLTTAARQVLIGGGVGKGRIELLDTVREKVVEQLRGYLPHVTPSTIEAVVRAPVLGDQAGPLGAIALALDLVA